VPGNAEGNVPGNAEGNVPGNAEVVAQLASRSQAISVIVSG
jgi:hypothetical protein